jgi:hypothetical protein
MYDPSDPRAGLVATSARKPSGPFAPAQAVDFSTRLADETGEGYRLSHWRARNLIVVVVELAGTFALTRSAQMDEYIALTLDPIALTVTTDSGCQSLPGNRLTIIPPGPSQVTAQGKGTLTLLFSARNTDLAAKCANTAAFATADPHIPAFQPWPDPPMGFCLRSYDLDVPPQAGRFGRIFRCTTMMVNVLDPRIGPRDPSKVSPHHHDDFEQVSLALKGAFRHLLRWPWTPDMTDWRMDEAINLGSPSACVIPPPAVHTSLSTDVGENQLVDLFAPPRLDFSLKPGWVLNADDYPLPAFAIG